VAAVARLERLDSAPDLSERVYRQLLTAICEGRLPPGARLRQEELAASLDVSRQPIHHALRLLKKDGLAIDAGRRGLLVAPLESRHVEQLYQVRAVLDGLAARQTARSGRRLDPSLIAAGRKAFAERSVGDMIAADMRFHEAIYAASGNPLIAESAGRHWHHIARAMGAFLGRSGARAPVWDEHEAILAAINRGDVEQAEALARGHCEAAGASLAAQVRSHFEEAFA
jgi:DNA-binding GntR family transcriptional regulator